MKKFSGMFFLVQVVILLTALLAWMPALAQTGDPPTAEPLVLSDEQDQYPLGFNLDILRDPGGELTIDEVISPEYEAQFFPSQAAVPIFGFTRDVFWVRFRLDNETRQTVHWLLEQGFANTQYIDLYTPRPGDGGFTARQTGTLRPVSTRDVPHPRIIFNLTIQPHSQQTYYLRVQNGASMTLALTLWTQAAFLRYSLVEQAWKGIFYGALIALFIYNLFLLYSVRKASYVYFVLLLAVLIIEEASYDGYLHAYLVPNLTMGMRYIQPVSFSLLLALMVLFSDTFLELRARLPRLHRFNLLILAVWGAMIFMTPFTSYNFIANLVVPWTLISLLVVFIVGVLSWMRGFQSARFFMLAWFGLLTGVFIVILIRLGVLSSTFLGENIYRLGFVWMAVCWSIALADHINFLKTETENANRDLEKSEHRLSQILEGLPIGVVVYGNNLKPRYINQRTLEIIGNPTDVSPADLAAVSQLPETIADYSLREAGTGQAYPLEDIPVYRALHGEPASADDIMINMNDQSIQLEVHASPVLDDSGEVESAVVAFQDITQRKRAETELLEYRKDLEQLVEERTKDLSAVNEQLQQEAAERSYLEQLLKLRIGWLSAIQTIHQDIGGSSDLPQAYEKLTAKILELLDGQLVFILLWNDQDEQPAVHYASINDGSLSELTGFRNAFQDNSPLRLELELGESILLSPDSASALSEHLSDYLQDGGNGLFVLTPMVSRKSPVGVLGVVFPESARDVSLLQVDMVKEIARDLVGLARDASLLDHARAVVTSEERQRLARELHDSVTQTLFTASVLAEATPRIWEKDQAIARTNMEKLSVLIRGALADMRSLLIELRITDFQNQSLSTLLNTLAEAARARSRADITITIHDDPALPKKVTEAFYRVAREALNNVIVHAHATQVDMSFFDRRGRATLSIRDNGRGFDHQADPAGHLGIKIMGERAEGIGGDLQIRSQAGQGTEIILIWSENGEPKKNG
jgi:signal transduction histidine kinase